MFKTIALLAAVSLPALGQIHLSLKALTGESRANSMAVVDIGFIRGIGQSLSLVLTIFNPGDSIRQSDRVGLYRKNCRILSDPIW